jgi:N-methylhydantoinase A
MRIGADIGGTFTDIVALFDDGRTVTRKVPSTPDDYSRGILAGIESILKETGLTGESVREVVHATTVATNAILSRSGAKTGLITTKGFRDILEIRRLRVPEQYNLRWEKPKPLVDRYLRLEVAERVRADGSVMTPLSEGDVRAAIERLKHYGVEAVAVCLINSYTNPSHELRVGELLRKAGSWEASLSCEVLPEIKEYERTSTTVINAYVMPTAKKYLSRLEEKLRGHGIEGPLLVMQSGGGVMSVAAALRRPVYIVESGPAAGVIAAADLGGRSGYRNLITLDMGGTTAKASIIEDGRVQRSSEYEVGGGISLSSRLMGGGGYLLKVPAIDLAEIGAGGGSVVWIDRGGAVQVGPVSAGADPGPVSYDLGGQEPTVTDSNLLLGYLNPEALAGGAIRLNGQKARKVFQDKVAKPLGLDLLRAAYGVYEIANARMIRAVRAVSSERGRDPTDFAMIAFGGNGPVHAAQMAKTLGIGRVIVPPSPGLFSAFGLLRSEMTCHRSRTILTRTDRIADEKLKEEFKALQSAAREELGSDGAGTAAAWTADLRYVGQSYELNVSVPDGPLSGLGAYLRGRFEEEHERTYGHRAESDPVEIVNLRVAVSVLREDVSGGVKERIGEGEQRSRGEQERAYEREAYFGPERGLTKTPVIGRDALGSRPMEGPLIVEEYDATTVVPPGCTAALDTQGNIVIGVDA